MEKPANVIIKVAEVSSRLTPVESTQISYAIWNCNESYVIATRMRSIHGRHLRKCVGKALRKNLGETDAVLSRAGTLISTAAH